MIQISDILYLKTKDERENKIWQISIMMQMLT